MVVGFAGNIARMKMPIHCRDVERLHLLKGIQLLKMSPDYMISKIRALLRAVNSERNQFFFLFKKPHNEAADKNTNDLFTLKGKISERAASASVR